MKHPIELGAQVRDKLTGFEGVAVSCVYYLTGCTQIGVVPKVNDKGEPRGTEYYDYQRLEVTGAGVQLGSKDAGGPQRDAPTR